MTTPPSFGHADHELVLSRLIDVPRAKLFRCWTEPALVIQWFTPPPWKTVSAEIDLRPGGTSLVTMEGPDGTRIPNHGVYLDIVKNERIVVTDAYTSAWVPSPKPFVTCIIEFGDEAGQTRYTARARHWTAEDKAAHEAMGFHEGWGIATDQLTRVAASL